MPVPDLSGGRMASPPDRRGAFFLLFTALMAIGMGNTMLVSAVVPPLTRQLELPDWMAGAIFSLSALCWSLSSPFWGKRSNQWGRRSVAAVGLSGYAVSMLLFLLVSWAALINVLTGILYIFACLAFSRGVFGLFGSGVSPAAQAYVADRTAPGQRQKEIAFVTSGLSFGMILGPAFAAVLVFNFGLLSPVVVTCIIAAIMAVLLWIFLPERRDPVADATRIDTMPEGRGLWFSHNVWPFLVFAVLLSLVTGIMTQVFVFAVMDKLNVGGIEVAKYTGPAFMVGAMAVMLAQLVLIPQLRLQNRTLMLVGCLPLLIGVLLLIPARGYATLILAQFFFGIGQGLARPGFSSGASLAVPPQLQGNVAGLVISATGMGYIVTPFFGLFVYEFVNPVLPFWICSALIIIMAAFTWWGLSPGTGEASSDSPSHRAR